jgi:two-component system, NarL family, response regulator DegU
MSSDPINSIRVLIVDDHAAIRAGLRALLQREEDIEIAGEARNGEEALILVQELQPDVILLDIAMPGLQGTEVAAEIQAMELPVQILVVSSQTDYSTLLRLLRSGINGYLLKSEVPECLAMAIRDVSKEEGIWFSPEIEQYISGK